MHCKSYFYPSRDNPANNKKRRLATLAGVDIDGMDVLCLNLEILGGTATDFVKQGIENYMTVCGTIAAARSVSSCLDTLHGMRNIVHRYSHRNGEDVDALPNVASLLHFKSRDSKKHDSRPLFANHSISDLAKIDRIEDCGDEVFKFRKAVQGWYSTTLNNRKGQSHTPLMSLQSVRQLCVNHVTDPLLLAIFLGVLDEPTHSITPEILRIQESIRNGSFYGKIVGSVGCWILPEIEEIGFPSSHGHVCNFQRDLFEDLLMQAEQYHGISRRRSLLFFLLSCIGFDGSIYVTSGVELTITDHPSQISFFKDIYKELFDIEPKEDKKPPPIPFGKDITTLQVNAKGNVQKMCLAFEEVIPDDEDADFLPRKKLNNLRKHASDGRAAVAVAVRRSAASFGLLGSSSGSSGSSSAEDSSSDED